MGLFKKVFVTLSTAIGGYYAATYVYAGQVHFEPAKLPPSPMRNCFTFSDSRTQTVKLGTSNLQLQVLEVGKNTPKKEMIIFLHGFPETGLTSWHNQLHHFGALGKYFIIAPDQRGYNESDKPKGRREYTLDKLATDVVDLMEHYKKDKAIVIGHDWGGAVAFQVAGQYPNKVSKLVILNVPHAASLRDALFTNYKQTLKSYYIFAFQAPYVNEKILERNNFSLLFKALTDDVPQGAFPRESYLVYSRAWSQPGAMTGMLNWYRAMPFSKINEDPIKVPTLLLWGDKDSALDPSLLQSTLKYTPNAKVVLFQGVSHWIQHEKPKEVNNEIQKFLEK